MAASNKSVGLQISFGIVALLTIILGVGWYLTYRDFQDNLAELAEAQTKLTNEQTVSRDLDNDLEVLKGMTGHEFPEVGNPQDAGANTVLGGIQGDLAKVPDLQTGTYSAAVAFLNQRLDDVGSERDTKSQELSDANKKISELRGEYQTMVDQHKEAREAAERDNQDLIRSKDEEVRNKQAQIDDLRRSLNDLQVEYDDARAAWDTERKKFQSDQEQLIAQVDNLREKLKDATRVSFERADGLVRWVDNTAGLVWINLGSDDGLKTRTTFSVYRKGHHGVGGGDAEDIKGSIEITRIMGGHSAEGRIVSEDIYDPISKGDPVYTPLWSPGRREKFAVVGLIDLDQDGILDRQRFHDLVADAGASLVHEVTDDGTRIRFTRFPNEWLDWSEGDPELDSDTKYLILADIPDPALAVREEDKEIRTRIAGQLDRFRDEARRLGIEEINLSDFLAYIGYRPSRRLFIPGVVERPYNLMSGAASVTTNEFVGNRAAAGSTSALFGRSRRLKPTANSAASGATSGLFGGRGAGSNYDK